MKIVKVISTKINSGASRLIKVLRMGKADIQEVLQSSSYGIDSSPIKDMRALYSETSVKGENVIIGYINKNQIADVGETRVFSTDSDGVLKTYIHLLNSGNMEIGGNADNMVRYSQMAASVNELKSDINLIKSLFTAWVPVSGDGGAVLKTAVTTWASTTLVEDISGAKINEILTL